MYKCTYTLDNFKRVWFVLFKSDWIVKIMLRRRQCSVTILLHYLLSELLSELSSSSLPFPGKNLVTSKSGRSSHGTRSSASTRCRASRGIVSAPTIVSHSTLDSRYFSISRICPVKYKMAVCCFLNWIFMCMYLAVDYGVGASHVTNHCNKLWSPGQV